MLFYVYLDLFITHMGFKEKNGQKYKKSDLLNIFIIYYLGLLAGCAVLKTFFPVKSHNRVSNVEATLGLRTTFAGQVYILCIL